MDHVSDSQPQPHPQPLLHASPNSMYFDLLPTDILSTIIKYVFLRTNCKRNEDLDTFSTRRLQILNLSLLVADGSPFREVVSQLPLTNLKLTPFRNGSGLWVDNGLLGVGPELFENEELEVGILERMLQLGGKSVKSVAFSPNLYISFHEANSTGLVQKLARLVKIYCPNVEHLSLTLPTIEHCVRSLLEQVSLQLRSITLGVEVGNLDCLRLPDISMCTNIRKLVFPASPLLISFLRTRGTSVEFLFVLDGDVNVCTEMIDAIEDNCKKLTTLLFYNYSTIIETVGEERYASFLCSFGSELIYGGVQALSIGSMAQVVKACPNMLVLSQVVNGIAVDEWERLSLLGPMVECLTVRADKCLDEECEEAIAKCTNLKSLFIDQHHANEEHGTSSSSNLTFLFSISSASLHKFGHDDFIATQPNIDTLSSALKNLHDLELNLVKPIKNGVDFKPITQSSPQLNSVYISECFSDDEEREKDLSVKVLRMLVNAFSKCRTINFGIVNNETETVTRDEIRDICGSLPCRGVDVQIKVGSTWYLQVD